MPAPYASSSSTCAATPTAPSVHPAPDPGLHFAQPGPLLVERTTTGAFADSSQLWRVQWVRERRLVRDRPCPRDGRPLTDPLDLARDEWLDQALRDYVASRPNLTTATNPASQWLFPGRRADQPIHPGSLRLRMNNLGIPILSSRTAAIRHLLAQAPASVVADMLGYGHTHAESVAVAAGARWQRYAADRSSSR